MSSQDDRHQRGTGGPALLRIDRRRVNFGLGLGIGAALGLLPARADDIDDDILPSGLESVETPAEPETAPPPVPRTRMLKPAPAALRLKPPPARETGVLAFDSIVPGPLVRAVRGQKIELALDNALAAPTTIHWHGVRLPNAMDGVAGLTQDAVAAGHQFNIAFPARDAGTFWYRPMVPASAAEQTERGLYGLLVVDETEPPPFDADIALVIDDWALAPDDQIRPSFAEPAELAFAGRLGNWLTVNSAPPPHTVRAAPGGRVRLRLLNAANARPISVRFDDLRAHVIAYDGQPCDPFEPARGQLALLPGARADLSVEVPNEGSKGSLVAVLGPGVPLCVIEGQGEPSPLRGSPVPVLPSNGLPETIDLQSATRAEVAIAGGLDPSRVKPGEAISVPDQARIWTMNGIAWPDAQKPILSVKSGRPVSIGFVNRTPFLQALHVHGHSVRLLHNLDDGWEPYWLDTVPVPPGGTARIAFIAETPGKWMISSTILERLSSGLAGWFEVT